MHHCNYDNYYNYYIIVLHPATSPLARERDPSGTQLSLARPIIQLPCFEALKGLVCSLWPSLGRDVSSLGHIGFRFNNRKPVGQTVPPMSHSCSPIYLLHYSLHTPVQRFRGGRAVVSKRISRTTENGTREGRVRLAGVPLFKLEPVCQRLDTALPSEGYKRHTCHFNASKRGSWITGRAKDRYMYVPNVSLSPAKFYTTTSSSAVPLQRGYQISTNNTTFTIVLSLVTKQE